MEIPHHEYSPTASESEETSSDEEIPSDLIVEIAPDKQRSRQTTPQQPINLPMLRHAQRLLSNPSTLDAFLRKIYYYFTHKGFNAIVVEKILNLM